MLFDPVQFAYRTSRHDSTKFIPFFMVYKMDAKLPIELEIPPRPDNRDNLVAISIDEKIEKMINMRNNIETEASGNIKKAQDR